MTYQNSLLSGLLAVAIGCAATYYLYRAAVRWQTERQEAEFKQRSSNIAGAVHRAMEDRLQALHMLAAIAAVQPPEGGTDVSGERFAGAWPYLESYQQHNPGIQSLCWAPRLTAAERPSFEQAGQSAGSHFKLKELDASGKLVPAGARDEYFPLAAGTSSADLSTWGGFDLASDPPRKAALARARKGTMEAATPPFVLTDRHGRALVFQVYLPCWAHGGDRAGEPGDLRGFAVGTFTISEIVRVALAKLNLAGIDFLLYEGPKAGEARLVHAFKAGVSSAALDSKVEVVVPGGIHWDSTFHVAGRRWWALFVPSAQQLADKPDWLATGVLGGGFVVSLMLGVYVAMLGGRAARVRRLVEQQTSELHAANKELQDEVQQRKMASFLVRRLTRAVEQSPSAVIIADTTGAIAYANPRFIEMTGCRLGSHMGKPLPLLVPGQLKREELDALWRSIRAGQQWRGESLSRRESGEFFWVSVSVSPMLDEQGKMTEIVVIQEDITARKEAQQKLLDSEQRYRLLAENSTDMISRLTPGGVFTYVSPASRALLDYDAGDLEGRTLLDLVHPDHRVEVAEALKKVVAGSRVGPINHPLRKRDGKYAWVETVTKTIQGDGGETEILATSRDINERRHLEEQFRQAQKMEVVGRLAGGMAHDFNNYLTGIMGFAQITLKDLPPDSPLREYVEEIFHTGQNAATLVKQLLTFARKQVTRMELMDLDGLVGGMEKLIRTTIGEDLNLVMRTESKACIECDAGQLRQVMTNLVVNARDAMPDGGTLTITTSSVDIAEKDIEPLSELSAGPYVLLTVRDTGCGMTQEVIRRAFEPFFTTKGVGHGTGLGLATVYGIVKQMKGEIQLNSEPGAGTEFRIFLRRAQAAVAPATRTEQGPESRGRETILVVEDNDTVRAVSSAVLRSLGYEVMQARDGAEAFSICTRNNGNIDMIFTDVVMPQMSGPALVERLREARLNYKVVYTSGYNEHPFIEKSIREDNISFLHKPFTEEELARIVRQTLDAS